MCCLPFVETDGTAIIGKWLQEVSYVRAVAAGDGNHAKDAVLVDSEDNSRLGVLHKGTTKQELLWGWPAFGAIG
ncbi:hypothetical protein, partial [Aphanothece microscopica]|uniref:hypothetical protein n=1 Tax=Aphanothece microscopica TaxID=1049561 RepID=UPI003CE4D438